MDRDLYSRALNRALSLAEQWQGDQTPITRAQAAEQLMEVLTLHGWEQTTRTAETHLNLVPEPVKPESAADEEARR
ncbi:hypothetical protein [Streptomyces sp. t39]|uniref:hypothetical protein n=1 Tax=Streptomyces sp. t39 TaxID=1828156 RepID=UPI0011CD7736|nr:hypothetical protein [Streptomyces sp. t39]TXS50152.1 hypothetical protein EAO77_27980 [Streptomyces sp. t39]